MADEPTGDETHLAVNVARRYYLGGESKIEIGRSLGISRYKAARLLALARQLGLVRIEIHDPGDVVDPLAERLQRRFGLRECAVVRTGFDDATRPDPDAVARRLGEAGARLLERTLTEDDVLGLPASLAVQSAVASLRWLPRIPVVQLCGSVIIPGQDTAYDDVRRATSIAGSEGFYFHTPLVMPTTAGAAAIRDQPDVAKALAAIPRVTVVLCSIGAWRPGESRIHDAVSPADRAAAVAAGVIGETIGVLFGADGRPRDPELAGRLVAMSYEQLRDVATVVAMARGVDRADATRAALTGGLVHRLVVDEPLARALLEEE